MADTLEDVLADWRSKAQTVRAIGHEHDAQLIEQVCSQVARAAEDFLRWVDEPDAIIHSGKGVDWLRSRFPQWQRQGHARMHPTRPRARQYRLLILPVKANVHAAAADARRAARGENAA